IPNRAVKPARADGTAMQCGRVGRRLLLFVVPRAFPIDGKGAGDEFLCLLSSSAELLYNIFCVVALV
ncbi:MAG: hypothetical protein J5506_09705, partial [Prevotella sp.]|nr:hypothetical protein [Prevotella sp.]